jgi:hypothetical protein
MGCKYSLELLMMSGTPLIIRRSKPYLQPQVYIHIWWPAVLKAEWAISLGNGRSPYGLQIQFRTPDDEWCAARNMLSLWNNKFYYKAASCWYFYWVPALVFRNRMFVAIWLFGHGKWLQSHRVLLRMINQCCSCYSNNAIFPLLQESYNTGMQLNWRQFSFSKQFSTIFVPPVLNSFHCIVHSKSFIPLAVQSYLY